MALVKGCKDGALDGVKNPCDNFGVILVRSGVSFLIRGGCIYSFSNDLSFPSEEEAIVPSKYLLSFCPSMKCLR